MVLSTIVAVQTRGYPSGGAGPEYVKTYRLQYSADCTTFNAVCDNMVSIVFVSFNFSDIHARLLKMLGLYLLGQNCLHITFEQYLSSETYSRKYEKLPNIVILACKNITEKMHLLKMSGPQIWLCLFTFRPRRRNS